MERFTEYRNSINKYYIKGTNSAMVCFNGSEVSDKLGKLEDLEEKIGMPLLLLFNEVLGKSIYHIDYNEVDERRAMGLQLMVSRLQRSREKLEELNNENT